MEIKPNGIYNIDCREGLKNLNNNSVDLAIFSPPYNVGMPYEQGKTWQQFEQLMTSTFQLLEKVIKPGGYVFINFGENARGKELCNTEAITTYPMSVFYWSIRGQLELVATRIWRKQRHKLNFTGRQRSGPRPLFDYEHLWTFRKPSGNRREKVRNLKQSYKGVVGEDWTDPAHKNIHPAAYPKSLPSFAIEIYSDKKDIVLDCFCGIGTTLVAAKEMDRRYIGFEINEDYYHIAKRWIEKGKLHDNT